MTLTERQQRIVEANMGLVGRVIKDKVHGLGQEGAFTYDDLFQIGCIGLCNWLFLKNEVISMQYEQMIERSLPYMRMLLNSLVDEEVALVLLESTEVEKILDIQAVMIIGMEVIEKGVESPYQNPPAVYENRRRGIPVFDDSEEEIRYLLQPEYKQFLQAGMQALNLC